MGGPGPVQRFGEGDRDRVGAVAVDPSAQCRGQGFGDFPRVVAPGDPLGQAVRGLAPEPVQIHSRIEHRRRRRVAEQGPRGTGPEPHPGYALARLEPDAVMPRVGARDAEAPPHPEEVDAPVGDHVRPGHLASGLGGPANPQARRPGAQASPRRALRIDRSDCHGPNVASGCDGPGP